MKKILKYSSYVLAAGIALSGCVNAPNHSVRQATGDKVGKVVIYANSNANAETAGVFVNDRFIAALPEQHRLNHALCQGDYVLKARSVLPKTNKKNHIVHVTGQTQLRVVEGQTQYLMLNRTDKGWEFVATDKAPEGLKGNNDKLVRRVTDAMLQCK